MKKSKVGIMIGFLLILAMAASACGSKKAETMSTSSVNFDMAADTSTGTMTANTEEESAAEAPEESKSYGSKADGLEDSGISNSSAITVDAAAQSNDKIIRRFFLEVETQEFDSLITIIDSEIDRLAGYVESSDISGKRIYYSEEARYASIVVRVPKDKADEFVNSVKEKSNVVSKQESTENVTLAYTDIESRKKSLEIEQERLFVILEKADNLENIITLESRLSDIRYELQNYESQLRTYDNQVEYSTVTLSIQEVERMTPSSEEKKTVADRINNGFSNTIYNISEGLKNFVVWFVVNLPYLLIWVGIIAVIALIVRKFLKKSSAKKVMPQQPPQGPTPPVDGN